jgi:hypothetical protein
MRKLGLVWPVVLGLGLACCLLFVGTASANVSGAIFTTTSTGTKVNGNLYAHKTDVYLNGGPQNTNDPGLVPDGTYYFQVTDPSGSVLLSADDISCRQVVVQNGRIIGVPGDSEPFPFNVAASGTPNPCTSPGEGNHPLGTFNTSNNEEPVQLCPAVLSAPRTNTLGNATGVFDSSNWCDTTPNPGGEYKAWLTPVVSYIGTGTCSTGRNVFGFCDSESKTDNFKVQFTPPPPCTPGSPGCAAPSANLVACKYWDKNDDGAGLPDISADIILGGWTINASTTDASLNINSNGQSASGTTDGIYGCTTFTVTGFTDATTPSTVTLSEVQQLNWNQVGPLQGTYNGGSGGDINVNTPSGATPCQANLLGLVPPCTSTISVPLIGDGSTTVAPDFGNTGLDLTVSKTANPSFTRTYAWTVTKCAEDPNSTSCVGAPTKVDQAGGTVTFTYKVTATETGSNDSLWAVAGKITVTNPNTFDVSGVTVTDDDSANGGLCSVTNGTGVTVAAGTSVSLDYSCTYSSNPGSGTNTATAAWSSTTYPSIPDSSAQGQQSFTFGAPTSTVDQTITVTDCFNGTLNTTTGVCSGTGSIATILGTLTATDPPAAVTTHTYTYTRTVNVPRFGCISYSNTGRISTTPPQTAGATVQICGPEQTGALTMGFWQNKNGQGIITGQAKTGTCPSATWLRQFNPFMDLSATATCAQVASYVYNVIKLANASLTGNAMLKGQDLATSLDVYFSDPGLGGNKIGAPAPIGGLSIDLTKICKMIDSSGGTATCSGTFENVSSSFGLATSLTVYQMLAYAASQSNSGGGMWYGNIKSAIILAKDAFDAINNQVAFAP